MPSVIKLYICQHEILHLWGNYIGMLHSLSVMEGVNIDDKIKSRDAAVDHTARTLVKFATWVVEIIWEGYEYNLRNLEHPSTRLIPFHIRRQGLMNASGSLLGRFCQSSQSISPSIRRIRGFPLWLIPYAWMQCSEGLPGNAWLATTSVITCSSTWKKFKLISSASITTSQPSLNAMKEPSRPYRPKIAARDLSSSHHMRWEAGYSIIFERLAR